MNNIRKISISFALFFTIINIISQLFYFSDYIHFLETYFSTDSHISYPLIKFILIDLILLFGIAYLTFFVDWDDFKFSRINIIDKIAIIVILFIIITFQFKNQSNFISLLFSEDHFFENLTVIITLLTSTLLAINIKKFNDYFSKVFLILSSLTFFYWGMEEISWGQDIFKWGTPAELGKLNYQNETNTHNLLNPYFTIIYISFNLIITLVLLFSKLIKDLSERFSANEDFKNLIPSNANLYYAIIFSYLTINSYYISFGGEMTEQAFSIYGLIYALNLSLKNKILHFKNNSI